MSASSEQAGKPALRLIEVGKDNWRAVAGLQVTEEQRRHVADPAYYLALCAYGGTWRPLAIAAAERVVGFMMWAIDSADGSCWLGGILIDQSVQGQGFGREAVQSAIRKLARDQDPPSFALSYHPENSVARKLYLSLGFIESGEMEGDEIVARLAAPDRST